MILLVLKSYVINKITFLQLKSIQTKPIINNAKTLFKIANIIKSPSPTNTNSNTTPQKSNNSPVFYI